MCTGRARTSCWWWWPAAAYYYNNATRRDQDKGKSIAAALLFFSITCLFVCLFLSSLSLSFLFWGLLVTRLDSLRVFSKLSKTYPFVYFSQNDYSDDEDVGDAAAIVTQPESSAAVNETTSLNPSDKKPPTYTPGMWCLGCVHAIFPFFYNYHFEQCRRIFPFSTA